MEFRWCSECRAETPFEVPPCQDGHGAECPDLACVQCGFAITLGVAAVAVTEAAPLVPAAA